MEYSVDIVDNGQTTNFNNTQDQSLEAASISELMEVAVVYINKHGSMFYNCSICAKNIELVKLDTIESHIQDHFQHYPFSCHVCSEKFLSLGLLIEHSNVHSGREEKPVDPLQTIAIESDAVMSDINSDEGMEPTGDEEEVPLNSYDAMKLQKDGDCSFYENPIPSESDSSLTELEMLPQEKKKRKYEVRKVPKHKKDPTRRYPCEICKKQYSSQDYVKIHMRTHRDEKPFKCTLCDKRFSHSSYINVHMRSHTGEKPYMCTLCGLTFKSQSSLTKHVKSHTGARDFECDECGKSFARKEVLRMHKLTHSEQRPFACDICGKSFRRKNALQQHSKLHSDDKEYKCKICNDAFSQPAGLHNHMKNRHLTVAYESF